MTPTLMGSPRESAMSPPPVAHSCAFGVGACSRRAIPHTSGVRPILDAQLRLAEFIATLALAQDNGLGQPLESHLRSSLRASWICDEAGVEPNVRDDAYWVALLRYVGCTGHAHEV